MLNYILSQNYLKTIGLIVFIKLISLLKNTQFFIRVKEVVVLLIGSIFFNRKTLITCLQSVI